MPYSRFKNISEEKRQKILDTALNEFVEKNFKSASINQISKNAGLSAGALYYYFEDKEDLFYTTVNYAMSELREHIGNLDDIFIQYGYWEGITEIVMKRLELTQSHPKYMKLFYRMLISDDIVESKGRLHFLRPFQEIFEYGYENGYIRNDLPKDLLFNIHLNMTITVNKWSLDRYFSGTTEDIDLRSLSAETVMMIKRAIAQEV